MRYRKCMECENTYVLNENYFRLYNYTDREEYSKICMRCEKEKKNKYQKDRYKKMKQAEYDFSAKDWEDCLEYFGYCDAYTGMPLITPTIDHIIPVTQFGGTVKNNIVPCNTEINSSKGNRNMIKWYKKQDFYNEDRLNKILNWMGNYKKYLYIPVEQREYVDVNKSKTIYHYTITLPNGYKKKLYYPNKGNPKKLTLLLKRAILDDWNNYFNDNWLPKTDSKNYSSAYNKTKNILNRCGTFLIINSNEQDYAVLSDTDINKININELSLEGDWQNEDIEIELEETIGFLNTHLKTNHSADSVILKTRYDNKPIEPLPSKNKKSKTDKILEIYSRPDKEIESYTPIHISHTFNVWDKTTKIIKGRDGLIDKTKPYVAEWCIVDTNNEFIFQGNKYKINEKVKQYSPRSKKPKYDDYKNDYQMDRILAYEQDGQMFFFDQNIDRIDNDLIIRS